MKAKYLILYFLVFVLSEDVVQAQNEFRDTITVNDIFDIPEKNIANQKVIELDSAVSINDLMLKASNWAGKTFNNSEKVITSKTENQIIIDYNTKIFFGWKIRIILEFKSGKIRYSFIDNGNLYRNVMSSPVSEGTMRIQDYFERKGYIKKTGYWEKYRYSGVVEWKSDIIMTAKSLESALKDKNTSENW
jgi:hypothetical protein